jgi:hypothetical protein
MTSFRAPDPGPEVDAGDHELGAYDDDPPLSPELRGASARVTVEAPVHRDALTPEAEQAAFLSGLRATRNESLRRDALVFSAVSLIVAVTVALGSATPPAPPAPPRPEVAAAKDLPEVPSSEPALDPPTIEGKLARTDVVSAVGRSQSLSRCFEMGFERDPKLSGRLTLKMLVGETGDVIGVADVGSNVGDRGVVRCVARSMKALDLPRPDDGKRALVTYPMLVPAQR